jgi:predicted metalloprotease with PDZ domain
MVGLAACSLGGHAAASAPPSSKRAIEYRVALPRPDTQYVHVDMRVASPRGTSSDIAIPAWAPGSYLVRDFARHVYDLEASGDDGKPLETTRIDKQTWRVEHRGRPFHVRYRVFAAEKSVRTSHVDDRHASLVGTSVFAYVEGELDRPCRVVVDLPSGWSAHTALDPGPAAAGEAVFTAPDYDRLVDAPIELGSPVVRTFEVDGARFEYVVTGSDLAGVDIDRLVADARRIVQAQGGMMEGFPFARYVFLLELGEQGGGGLEHASSTSMMMRRTAFDDPEGYASARRLVAHEFFHLWNVKRIHDVALGPFDYSRENHSRLLWLHEGFTETVEAMSLLRAGFVKPEEWLSDLAGEWTTYLQRPGRNHAPISELSFEAWIKAYKPADNHPNVAVSYYEKGRMIGVALDLELRLRAASHGREGSLMGLFRRLQREFGAQDKGITQADVARAATAEAGEDMAWFFARHVDGKKDVPLPELMRKIGVHATSHAPWLHPDGTERADASRRRTWTGLELDKDGAVANVVPGSPADTAALMLHDEIVAIDGVRADTRERIEAVLAERGPGKTVEVALFRDGRLLTRSLALHETPHRIWRFTLEPEATLDDRTRTLRARWLAALP